MNTEPASRSVVIVGGGPGGYVAAIRAAQLGAEVTLIEGTHLGGTCLNEGCIPMKALLHCAKLAYTPSDGKMCGIHLRIDQIDWTEVRAYQESVIQRLVGGVKSLVRKNHITLVEGTAAFFKPKTLQITKQDGASEICEAEKIILATGSVPVWPPIPGLRESRYVLDSSGALKQDELPKSIIIIGGGVIGVEMACAFCTLGCRTVIVEALPRLLPSMDMELSFQLSEYLKCLGIDLFLGAKVLQVQDQGMGASVLIEGDKGRQELIADRIICAAGRKPNTMLLNPEAGGLRCHQGRIIVDEHQQTNIPGVYAVGDCSSGIMLAHTASIQGEIAAENAMGGQSVYQADLVPSGVYSFPELAGVGLTEEQANQRGISFHVGRFPLSANGRALIENDGVGMVKILVGEEVGELLGIHILAPHATELIAAAATALSMEGTVDDVIHTIFAHPTISEAIREAALAAEERPIHTVRKTK